LSFSDPYVFDRNISAGIDIYRRDYDNDFFDRGRATYEQSTTGLSLRAGVPLTEYTSLVASYTLNIDDVRVDENQFFSDFDGDGIRTCEPAFAGRFLCEAIGKRTSSILGLSLNYSTLNSRLRPTRGRSISVTGEIAGLGGDVRYGRMRGKAAQYFPLPAGFIGSLTRATTVATAQTMS